MEAAVVIFAFPLPSELETALHEAVQGSPNDLWLGRWMKTSLSKEKIEIYENLHGSLCKCQVLPRFCLWRHKDVKSSYRGRFPAPTHFWDLSWGLHLFADGVQKNKTDETVSF